MVTILLNVFLIYPPGQEIAQVPRVVISEDSGKKGEGRLELPGGETVAVSTFTFQGNKAIKTEDLERLTNPYLNRPLSLAEVQSICGRIKALYNQQGYPDAEVYALAVGKNAHTLQIVIEEKGSTKSSG